MTDIFRRHFHVNFLKTKFWLQFDTNVLIPEMKIYLVPIFSSLSPQGNCGNYQYIKLIMFYDEAGACGGWAVA